MALTVELEANAAIALDKVHELRLNGLTQGLHFDFKYVPPVDNWLQNEYTSGKVVFTFYDPHLATFYSLKWL
jgi:hypothetical protein